MIAALEARPTGAGQKAGTATRSRLTLVVHSASPSGGEISERFGRQR